MKRHLTAALAALWLPLWAAADIAGTVTDAATGETVIGATVRLDGGKAGITATDLDGKFLFKGNFTGTRPLRVSMIGYADADTTITGNATGLRIPLRTSASAIEEVTVIGKKSMKGDAAMTEKVREEVSVATAVGSEAISRTQDRNAGEVVKRLSGISLLNEKFIVARGLSQRYNDVWVNNAPVPSSEADSRSFSLDIIPASQIENIVVYKSPAPDIPADFTGGFVRITTRDTPDAHPFTASVATGMNTQTTFRPYLYNPGSGTDWLGFDSGLRSMRGGMDGAWDNGNQPFVDAMSKGGFNNDWSIRRRHALPFLKVNAAGGHQWWLADGDRLSLNASLNYSNTTQRFAPMLNARYGIYNIADDRPEYLYNYTDERYQNTVRWGAMLNLAWMRGASRITLRNIFNQTGESRLTLRRGWQNISSRYDQEKTEYLYTSRTSYCGQLAGFHPVGDDSKLDWEGSFTFANKHQPDRRIINREQNDLYGDPHYGQMQVDQNDIQRDFVRLREYMASASASYDFPLPWARLKVGAHGQYRWRNYKNRTFYYRFHDDGPLSPDFGYGDPQADILLPENYGADKLYLYDDTDNRDSYSGHELQWSAYGALTVPLGAFKLHGGVRFEQARMTLTSFTHIHGTNTQDRTYNWVGAYPSLNATYLLNGYMQLRAAYGMSTNRPEFREVSPSVYYDFELFSDIKGNPDLKSATIQNADLRWEWYPAPGQSVSAGVFYKYFANPIENTFLDAGGSYTFTFENAQSAWLAGVEVDARKRLDFIGAPWLMLNANISLIHSRVNFATESLEHNRQMQGQSPYIINAGLFYQPEGGRLTTGLSYNRIGKRIVGIGRTDMSVGGSINNDIPDMYEMPRNALDYTASWQFTPSWQLKFAAKDILNEAVEFCQFPKYRVSDFKIEERKETTRRFKPGVTLELTLTYTL